MLLVPTTDLLSAPFGVGPQLSLWLVTKVCNPSLVNQTNLSLASTMAYENYDRERRGGGERSEEMVRNYKKSI